MLLEVGGVLVVLLFFLYKWATKDFDIFEKRGIPFEKPVPIFGNTWNIFKKKSNLFLELRDFCRRHKQHKVVGYFNMKLPLFMILDPEMIKKVAIKDFDHFPNHRPFMQMECEPLVDNMLSIMRDQRWKDMRNTLTPVFTASKMRAMFSLMNECFDECIRHLKKRSSDGAPFDIEMKDCFTRLSNDIIASTAFGLKLNSFEDKNNEFYKIGQAITNFRGAKMLKFLVSILFPKLFIIFRVKVFDQEKCNYFSRLVLDAMKQRQEQNIIRSDMIQLLIEAKRESSHEWTDTDLVAQCFVFFFAAFENNANLLCLTCHELMENPDIQQRLYEEILQTKEDLNGNTLNYDTLNKMPYMEMVVSEVLRKWSLAPSTDRVCRKDYKLYDDDGNFIVKFKEGDNVWFPIMGLHHNEDFFEEPERFDPERFNEENKKNIKPFTYLPFGVGPRICIGNRYALMQAKAMLYYLLLNFKLERSDKTVKDLLRDASGFQITPVGGFWLKFIPRQ